MVRGALVDPRSHAEAPAPYNVLPELTVPGLAVGESIEQVEDFPAPEHVTTVHCRERGSRLGVSSDVATRLVGGGDRVRARRMVRRVEAPQALPVDREVTRRRDVQSLMYGCPSAAGGLALPTSPATTIMVTMYGAIDRNSDGIGVPRMPNFC